MWSLTDSAPTCLILVIITMSSSALTMESVSHESGVGGAGATNCTGCRVWRPRQNPLCGHVLGYAVGEDGPDHYCTLLFLRLGKESLEGRGPQMLV